jgi:hypothetical protein
MKKILLTCFTYLSFTSVSTAQDFDMDADAKFTIGSKAGLNLSNVYDTKGDAFNADAKFGFAIGAFATIPFGNFLAFQPELLISQKGFQATGYLLGSTYSVTRTTTYLDFPLLFAIRTTQFLTFVMGPQYSYFIQSKRCLWFSNNNN